jgi:endonuclease/exonuclease/phosphatase family metal-dependent hydrolase
MRDTTFIDSDPDPAAALPATPELKRTVIVSWNLLRTIGASIDDVIRLIRDEQPDLLLMQEATTAIDRLEDRIGGHYARSPLPGRIHGVACWSPHPFISAPVVHPLQPGTLIRRVCQVIDMGAFAVANVHLSHGQVLNRRQLRRIATFLPPAGAVLGDFNLFGPALLPGFRDVGPKGATHRMADIMPIRLDRCLARGLDCVEARVLPHQPSDHHPIRVTLRCRTLPHKVVPHR